MKSHMLRDTVTALFAGNKGLLAMDESTPTCNKRFAALGDSPNCRGAAGLSRIDCDHAKAR